MLRCGRLHTEGVRTSAAIHTTQAGNTRIQILVCIDRKRKRHNIRIFMCVRLRGGLHLSFYIKSNNMYIEHFAFYFLLFQFVAVLFYKFGGPGIVGRMSAALQSKLLGKLSECEFCLEWWFIAVPSCIALAVYMAAPILLLYGPCAVALSYILKRF